MPDIAYLLLASGLVALGWGVARTVWAFVALHTGDNVELADPKAAPQPS